MFRKRRHPAPDFGILPPYQPLTGERAALQVQGVFPYCVLMQVAKLDSFDDYVICRGFDVRHNKFIDYEAGNSDKPGIPVAKPYGSRAAGIYQIGEMHAAFLPFQSSNASPTGADIRIGQNPGKAATTQGHPADLSEEVEELTVSEVAVNWMFIGSSGSGILRGKLDDDLNSGSSATMSIWDGDPLADTGGNVTVFDSSTLPKITAAYKIASGSGLDAEVKGGKVYLSVPYTCEVAQ